MFNYSGFKQNYFDKIVILEVFEHLDEDERAMRILHGWMKKSGSLIASVPNKAFLHIINPVKYAEHKRHYSNKEFLLKLQAAGFKPNHFNLVENGWMLVNLYLHLFSKFILRKQSRFDKLGHLTGKTYMQKNRSGLDIIVRAEKV